MSTPCAVFEIYHRQTIILMKVFVLDGRKSFFLFTVFWKFLPLCIICHLLLVTNSQENIISRFEKKRLHLNIKTAAHQLNNYWHLSFQSFEWKVVWAQKFSSESGSEMLWVKFVCEFVCKNVFVGKMRSNKRQQQMLWDKTASKL